MSSEEWELIGALLGDGFIHYKEGKRYTIGFVGHPKNDAKYYNYLLNLIYKHWNKKPEPKIRERALRVTIHSKKICQKLISLGLHYNKGKHRKAEIPEEAFDKKENLISIIRGVFDTDGTVFTSDKPGSPNYPSIEIELCSKKLIEQLKSSLEELGFRVTNISEYDPINPNADKKYTIGLHGRKNLENWLKTIGFSNPYKNKRAESYLNS